MTKVTIHAAKTNLSKLIAKVEAGEEIVICRGSEPVATLSPLRKPNADQTQLNDAIYDPWSAKDFSPGIMDDEPSWGTNGVWDGRSPRKPGLLKGAISLDASFFDALTDEDMGFGEDSAPEKPS